jgi:hypothetical protein
MLSGVRLIDSSGDDDQERTRRKDRTKNRHRKHDEMKHKEKKSRKDRRERESEGTRHEEDDRGQGIDRDALRQNWEKSDKDDTQRYGDNEIAKTQGWEGEFVQAGDKRSEREEWMTVPLARPKSKEAVEETREEKVRWWILV